MVLALAVTAAIGRCADLTAYWLANWLARPTCHPCPSLRCGDSAEVPACPVCPSLSCGSVDCGRVSAEAPTVACGRCETCPAVEETVCVAGGLPWHLLALALLIGLCAGIACGQVTHCRRRRPQQLVAIREDGERGGEGEGAEARRLAPLDRRLGPGAHGRGVLE